MYLKRLLVRSLSSSFSLEPKGKCVTEQVSEELGHSAHLNQAVVVDVEVAPGLLECALSNSVFLVGVHDLFGHGGGTFSVQEELAGRAAAVLNLHSIAVDQRVHQSIISFLTEAGRHLVPPVVLHIVSSLSIIAMGVPPLQVTWLVKLCKGPVVVHMGGEGAIGMSVLGHGASDVWLRVLLHQSPIIVNVAGEGAIWMGILWHGSPDVWLRVFTQLWQSPIVMHVRRESTVWVGVLGHGTSDIRLRVFLHQSPVIVDMGRESGVWMGVLGHWSSNIWLWVFFLLS